jgi:hypothetical protein
MTNIKNPRIRSQCIWNESTKEKRGTCPVSPTPSRRIGKRLHHALANMGIRLRSRSFGHRRAHGVPQYARDARVHGHAAHSRENCRRGREIILLAKYETDEPGPNRRRARHKGVRGRDRAARGALEHRGPRGAHSRPHRPHRPHRPVGPLSGHRDRQI